MIRRTPAYAAFAIVTFGGGLAALATGGAAVETALKARLQAQGIEAQAIRISTAGGGTLIADGVVARRGDVRIAVAQLTAPAGGSGKASADDVVVTTPRATYRAKHVELTGTNLSNADLAAILDAKTNVSMAERLAKITAAKIVVSEVLAEGMRGDVKLGKSYRDIVLSDVAGGRIGTASVGGISLAETDKAGAPLVQSTYRAMLAHGVDAGLMVRIDGDLRRDANEPKAKLFDDLSVEAMRHVWPKSELEIAASRVTLGATAARRLAAPLDVPEVDAPAAVRTERQRQQRFARIAVNVLDAVELGQMDASDIRIRDLGAAPRLDVTIAATHVAQQGADKISGVSLETIKLGGRTGTYQIAKIGADNIDIANLRAALKAVADGADTSDLAVRRNLTPIMDKLSLRTLDADVVDDDDDAGKAASGDRVKIHIDGMDLTQGKPLNGVPSSFKAALDHLTVATRGETFKPLADMGYGTLDLSSRFGFAWNEPAKELAIDDIWLNGAGMGALRLTAGFANVSGDLFSTDGPTMQAAAFGMLLKTLDLRLDNTGLVEKLIANQAKEDGRSVDEVRQSYVSAAGVGIPVLLGNGAAAKAIGAAAAKFVARPKSFHLNAKAPAGLAASDMQYLGTPDVLMNKLQVQVNAND